VVPDRRSADPAGWRCRFPRSASASRRPRDVTRGHWLFLPDECCRVSAEGRGYRRKVNSGGRSGYSSTGGPSYWTTPSEGRLPLSDRGRCDRADGVLLGGAERREVRTYLLGGSGSDGLLVSRTEGMLGGSSPPSDTADINRPLKNLEGLPLVHFVTSPLLVGAVAPRPRTALVTTAPCPAAPSRGAAGW